MISWPRAGMSSRSTTPASVPLTRCPASPPSTNSRRSPRQPSTRSASASTPSTCSTSAAPVGFRIALDHDERVRAIITQNGNAYTDGFGPGVAALAEWWADKAAGEAAVDWFVSLAGTQHQWQAGARDLEHIDPEQALADQLVLDRPGRAAYMKALLWDYQNNPPRYPQWQAWLRRRQPALLAIWGANDPFFIAAGAQAYRNDVPGAEVVLLDTGHFALEEEVDEIATHIGNLMATTFGAES